MPEGLSIRLSGPGIPETAKALAVRLVELGYKVEVLGEEAQKQLGSLKAAAYACGLLARNGVLVIVENTKVRPEGNSLEAAISPNDTPDFAAEKILDQLAEAGAISLEPADYTPEEEEQIRKRLADLGYIE